MKTITRTNCLIQLIALSTKPVLKSLLLLLLATLMSAISYAQIPSTYCDGNPSDLANFKTTYPISSYTMDPANAVMNSDNQFTIGSKDGDQVSAWRYSLGSANAKGDITNAGAALTGTSNCILRFFGDRTSDNGDASIGFWFFVSPVSTNADGTFSGTHTNGDLLILSDFTNGGAVPTIKVYTWKNGNLVLQNATSSSYCAAVNQIAYPAPAGFSYTASDGSKMYAPNTFYEGALDLCALNISSCFSTFMVETRNSQSITASLQDFAIGSFNATPPPPTATITQPTCTVSTGTVTVNNAVTGYTYTLTGVSPVRAAVTSTTGIFSNVLAGTYNLTASQGKCTSGITTIVVVPQPPTPAAPVLSTVQPTCTLATGSITVTSPTGTGLSYSIDGGTTYQTGVTFSGLAAGGYCIKVKNSSGCASAPTCATINAQPLTPDRPVVTITEATLCGTETAPSLTVNCPVTGNTYTLTQTGLSPKSITYSGSGTVVFTNLVAGKGFSVIATNASGCVSAATNCSNYTTNSCPVQAITSTTTSSAEMSVVPEILSATTKVTAYPNPYVDQVKFVIQSPVSGKGTLELYNLLGQKVETVYSGVIQPGVEQTIDYKVALRSRTALIYVFTMGSEKISGKLLKSK